MSRTTRTFIAIAVPSQQAEKLARLQAQLAAVVPAARWSTSSPFHLTLAFLGDVADEDLHAVCRTVAEASKPFPSFELRLEGVGAFPNASRPRVIWAGVAVPDGSPLFDLQKAVGDSLTKAGYRPDERFTPHVTLGRIRQDRRASRTLNLTSALQPFQNWSGGGFPVREVISFASTLSPEGPVYPLLARAPLSGEKYR